MEEINFLPNKNTVNKKKKEEKEKIEKIEYSKVTQSKINDPKPAGFRKFFSFFEKRPKINLKPVSINNAIHHESVKNSISAPNILKFSQSDKLQEKKNINQPLQPPTIEKVEKKHVEENKKKEKFIPPSFLQSNLIKSEVISYINWTKYLLLLGFFLILAILLLAIAYGSLFYMEKTYIDKMNKIDKNIAEINSEIRKAQEDYTKMGEFEKKLTLISNLFYNHIYWNEFLKFIEDATLENVYYGGFNGTIDGNYSFSATTDDFISIVKQVKAMKENKLIKSVKVNGGNYNKSGANFNLSIIVDTSVFYKNREEKIIK